MAPPHQRQSSYAKAAWASSISNDEQSSAATRAATAAASKQDRLKKLRSPPPVSFPLKAAVLLLADDPKEGQTVFLLDRAYVQNWLVWCLHQRCGAGESARLQEAVRVAALQLHLVPVPALGMPHAAPGPVDGRGLAMAGHPLLLDATVRVHGADGGEGAVNGSDAPKMVSNGGGGTASPNSSAGILFSRTHSLGTNRAASPAAEENQASLLALDRIRSAPMREEETSDAVLPSKFCVAVPERFYELLRSVHGVVCEDFETVSFQPAADFDRLVLLHHHHYTRDSQSDDVAPRPIEFRRKVVLQTAKEKAVHEGDPPLSLMEKLMLEQQMFVPQLVVEVHPIKLLYSCTAVVTAESPTATENGHGAGTEKLNGNGMSSCAKPQIRGFVLVSRDAPAVAAVAALQRVAAPNRAAQSVRTWSKWEYAAAAATRPPTATFDGYELVDVDALSEELPVQQQQQQSSGMVDGQVYAATTTTTAPQPRRVLSTGAWVEQHHAVADTKELELLVETRRTVNSPWPRAAYELENRLQPGDIVDAQDVAGKWYEAVVREVHDETVLLHYAGWASKWDAKARRRKPVAAAATKGESDSSPPPSPSGVPSKVKAPAPLWSHSGRWRERLQPGDAVEVRDSSSIVERPKWYRGVVKRVGGINDSPRPLKGGADLETYSLNDGEEKKPLLLLGRRQQILVEVDQERSDKASIGRSKNSPTSTDDSLTPHPPYLRWVNLFGEEICPAGTHLKDTKEEGPVTLQYEFDNNRKPVSVMKSHPMLGSGFMRESLRGIPPAPGSVGLHNLGNSCFLNSTLQCLNHIEPLTQFFLQDKYSKDLNKRNPLGSGGNVAVAYASLLKKMWGGNHSVLVPRLLKQTVANFAPQFDNSYQHDSHEFCQFLMDGLHEDLNRVKKKPYVEELEGFGMEDQKAAIESWRKHLLRHDSIIVDHCQGMHRSHLTCPQCGRESIKFDVYSSISLPLPTEKIKAAINLEDCIEKFMEAEQLDERDAYYCPNCRRHVCALKLIALWTVPDVLILHLKRFTFDTCMLSGGMLRSKVDNTVIFPINGLDLSKQVLGPIDPSAPPIYNLFGVSEHTGPTANSGHYTATIRNSVDGHWYRCNDSHVGITSGEAAITGGAYLLFYQRAKGITKWGGLHKVMKELGIDPYGGMDPIDEEGFRQVKNKKKKG